MIIILLFKYCIYFHLLSVNMGIKPVWGAWAEQELSCTQINCCSYCGPICADH